MEFLAKLFNRLNQFCVLEQLNSGWGEIEPGIIWIFVIDIMFVSWALFRIQHVCAGLHYFISSHLVEYASSSIYHNQVCIQSSLHCFQEDDLFILPCCELQDLSILNDLVDHDFVIIQSNESKLAHNITT